ncbi:MAG: MarR family winged helix-turn-helix transcriptional regulator, partial [Flavobacteriales bacterium]
EEIKQKKFLNEYQKLGINLMYTASWVMGSHNQRMKKFGISLQQFNILRILRGQYPNPAPLKLLTERMIDKMSNTSRLVEKLVQKKLVERKTCKLNRRQVDIVITPLGLDLVEKASLAVETDLKDIFMLSNEEAKTVNDLLDKMRG